MLLLLLLLSRISCVWLCATPQTGSPPGSPVPGILQARTVEWVAISFSNAWKWKVKVKSLSRVRLFSTPWTAAYQAPLSMGIARQEYWSRVPLPSHIYIYMYKLNLFAATCTNIHTKWEMWKWQPPPSVHARCCHQRIYKRASGS